MSPGPMSSGPAHDPGLRRARDDVGRSKYRGHVLVSDRAEEVHAAADTEFIGEVAQPSSLRIAVQLRRFRTADDDQFGVRN